MSHAATCGVALRKVEAAFTFSATGISLQWNAIALQVARKIASCDMALSERGCFISLL